MIHELYEYGSVAGRYYSQKEQYNVTDEGIIASNVLMTWEQLEGVQLVTVKNARLIMFKLKDPIAFMRSQNFIRRMSLGNNWTKYGFPVVIYPFSKNYSEVHLFHVLAKEIRIHSNYWEADDETLYDTLQDLLYDKIFYGDCMDVLSEEEKVFLSMAELEIEVNNGGFDQFFFNTDNEWNDMLVYAAHEIGAHEIAKICEKAISILSLHLDSESQMERLDECDEDFYHESCDDISSLCSRYAREHQSSFLFK